MDVILMQRVENLGELGQVVSVARGYARNYLIPRGLAVLATEGARNVVAERIALVKKRDDLHRASAEEIAQRFADRELSVTLAVQASEDDRLFGSVAARDIAAALADQGYDFDQHQIQLEEPIKQLGVYTVPLKLHAEVDVPVKVWVTRADRAK
jgi:large subunit ribosomal protein L9